MSTSYLKAALLIATALATAAIAIAYLLSPYIGSLYLNMVKETGDVLPALTSEFTLPLLRPDLCNPFEPPATPFWVHLIWLLLFAGPSLILVYAWKAESREELLARWVSGMAIYTPVLFIIILTVMSGLIIAITCM